MPSLILITNVKLDETAAKEFTLEFSKIGASVLQKPEAYISVVYNYNPTLTFGGNHNPAFLLEVGSLKNINPEANIKYSQGLFSFLGDKLGVSDDRGYIHFVDPGVENFGYKGTTFAVLWK